MFGIDMGFWIGMGTVALAVVVYVSVAWGLSPKNKKG